MLAAEAELKLLSELSGGTYLDNDLLRHNLVVFRGGENALQVCAYVCVYVCVLAVLCQVCLRSKWCRCRHLLHTCPPHYPVRAGVKLLSLPCARSMRYRLPSLSV